MAPLYILDDFGGHLTCPDHVEPADPVLYHQRIKQIAIVDTERNLRSDMYKAGIQNVELLCLEAAIYRIDTVKRVQDEIMEMLNNRKAY